MEKENFLISIIIPYYNTYDYTIKLIDKLKKQLTDDVEVIIIDDYSNKPLDIEMPLDKMYTIRLLKNSGGASLPRNLGLALARGKYIAFIDSDDMITDNYLKEIKQAITKNTDIIYLSWKLKDRNIIITKEPPKWNCAVWCRVYKREIIGDVKFDENLRIAEDYKFNHSLNPKTSTCINTPIYIYNSGRKGSIMTGD